MKKPPIDVQFRILVIRMLAQLVAALVLRRACGVEVEQTIIEAYDWLDEVRKDYR